MQAYIENEYHQFNMFCKNFCLMKVVRCCRYVQTPLVLVMIGIGEKSGSGTYGVGVILINLCFMLSLRSYFLSSIKTSCSFYVTLVLAAHGTAVVYIAEC